MQLNMNLILVVLMGVLVCSFSFIHHNKLSSSTTTTKGRLQKSSQLNSLTESLLTAILQKVPSSQAKGEFYFFFFGGSGALGIGAAQVPKLIKEFEAVKALGGKTSLGGDNLNCSPLATIGYPEPLKIKDIEQIIKTAPTVDKILAKGQKKTYLAQLGYVERDAFDELLKTTNPLARYAIFEAISGGGGSNVASPKDVTEKLAEWRQPNGLESFKADLLTASLKKYSAFAVFAFLIALVLDLIVESGINAFLD